MSSVKITGNASGSGILTFSAPNTDSDRTINIPDKAGSIALGAGAIVQTLSTNLTSASTVSSTGSGASRTDISGLSVAITPTSSSSKILIIAYVNIIGDETANTVTIGLKRDSTAIFIGDSASSRPRGSANGYASDVDAGIISNTIVTLDSPSTTSATTYKIEAGSNATFYVNRTVQDSDNDDFTRSASSITVMEVLG